MIFGKVFKISDTEEFDDLIRYEGERILSPFKVNKGLSYVGKWNFLIIKNNLIFFDRKICSFMFLDRFDKRDTNIIFGIREKLKKSYIEVLFWDESIEQFIEIGKLSFEILDYRTHENILKCLYEILTDYSKIVKKIHTSYCCTLALEFRDLIKKCIINSPKYDKFLDDNLISDLKYACLLDELAKIRNNRIRINCDKVI